MVGNDPDSLAEAMEKMSKLELDKMGKNGWKWMKAEFGWGSISNRVSDVYGRLLQEEYRDS